MQRPLPAGQGAHRREGPTADVSTMAFSIRTADWRRDREALMDIRFAVFVEEQHVDPNIELDDWDPQSHHALGCAEDGTAIGTGRLLPDGHIGRLAVLPAWRGQGVGTALMRWLIALGRAHGHTRLELSAQTHALAFYERLGFTAEGDVYMEAGIPHRHMFLNVSELPASD